MASSFDHPITESIAILPFVNMSSDAEHEYFSDGITEEIINALTRVEGLRVIARTSSFAFKNKNMDVREIGKQLGVSTILEGSVRMASRKVRITAQLINVADGFHFWSETFDRPLEDIFLVQDEISLLIADKLRENIGHFNLQDRLVEIPTVPLAIYQQYLKGKYYVRKMNVVDVKKGQTILQEVIDRQPDFPMPYLGMHYAYTFLGVIGVMDIAVAFTRGNPYLEKALELNSELPECQFHLGGIYHRQHWDFDKAYQHLAAALEKRPGYADAYQSLASILFAHNNLEAAMENIDIALRLDPLSPLNHYYKGMIYYFGGKYDRAVAHFKKSLAIEPKFIFSDIVWGATLLKMGRIEEGLARFQNLPLSGEIDMSKVGGSTLAYVLLGETEKVEEGLKQLEAALQSDVMGRALMFLIFIHTTLGNYEAALQLVEQGIEKRVSTMLLMNVSPFTKPLQSLPKFKKLMHDIFGNTQILKLRKRKYAKSALGEEETTVLYDRLEKQMADKQPFLEPNLSLRQLAESIDMHPNQLSQVLNERAGQNFSAYINSYRLEAFKARVAAPANRQMTILALAYDSGFSSKTVFNTFFKKKMGITPKEYWRRVVEV